MVLRLSFSFTNNIPADPMSTKYVFWLHAFSSMYLQVMSGVLGSTLPQKLDSQ